MDYLAHYERPELESPTLLFAFAGWADAAESATHALRYLIKHLGATKFAELDAEEFYDFTQVRPHIGFDDEGERVITWPANEFFVWRGQPDHSDLVMVVGIEPSLRWRRFSQVVLDVAQDLAVSRVVQLGALLDAVPHTRAPWLTGTATNPELLEQLEGVEVRRSRYTGPTGISSVIMDSFRRQGTPYMSVWGHAPHYLQVSPNPKVSLGLLKAVGNLLHVDFDMEPMRSQGDEFGRRVAQVVAQEPHVNKYVERLETHYDNRMSGGASGLGDMPEPEQAVQDLEEFLRQQRRDNGGSESES